METDFLELHKNSLQFAGFWEESFKTSLLFYIECQYKSHIIRDFAAVDVIIRGEKVLIKWAKRLIPLSDEDLKKKYNRT